MHTVDLLLVEYRKLDTPERFGQWFVNRYIKREDNDPDLQAVFYASTHLAYAHIRRWLDRHNYSFANPQTLKEISESRNS